MVVFPNCKINVGLNILDKRQDDFHNLETVFIPVPVKDVLEVITAKENTAGVIFSQSGDRIDGNTADNLSVRAYHLLKKDFPNLPAIQMHLHKTIPMGAGLGGGSADGAFAIKLLNDKFHLNLSTDQLISYSLTLGSDCPFFIVNQPSYATGRGDKIELINISLKSYHLVIVNPGIHINTGWAFAQLNNETAGKRQSKNLFYHIQQPVQTWRDTIENDFETPVFARYPELGQIKNKLYNYGAVFASMSGSGSSIYGIFNKHITNEFGFPKNYLAKIVLL